MDNQEAKLLYDAGQAKMFMTVPFLVGAEDVVNKYSRSEINQYTQVLTKHGLEKEAKELEKHYSSSEKYLEEEALKLTKSSMHFARTKRHKPL